MELYVWVKLNKIASYMKCLADTNCGWCTNSQGVGDCVEGTATAPLNIYKYRAN